MTRLIHGNRIGRNALLRIGCSAVLFDPTGEKILMTRRSDNGLWCLPSGGVDAGETVEETCVREVREETGLVVRVKRLIGVYSSPNTVIEYADGNRYQLIALCFEVEQVSGTLGVSSETTEAGYFSFAEIDQLELLQNHRQRIADAYANSLQAFIR